MLVQQFPLQGKNAVVRISCKMEMLYDIHIEAWFGSKILITMG